MKWRTKSRSFSPTPEIITGYFLVHSTMPRVDMQCWAMWRKRCRSFGIRSQSRTARLQPPCVWTRHGTECATIRASKNWRMPSHEPAEPLRGAEAAQRLQGYRRIHRRRMAGAPGSIDLVADFRSAILGDESARRDHRAWLCLCGDHLVGFRDVARRNEANGGRFGRRGAIVSLLEQAQVRRIYHQRCDDCGGIIRLPILSYAKIDNRVRRDQQIDRGSPVVE